MIEEEGKKKEEGGNCFVNGERGKGGAEGKSALPAHLERRPAKCFKTMMPRLFFRVLKIVLGLSLGLRDCMLLHTTTSRVFFTRETILLCFWVAREGVVLWLLV